MSINEYIYFGAWFTQLHKNPIFRKEMVNYFLISIEKGYLG